MAKQCPNCAIYIEKTGGCKWIRCICKKKWCWHCQKFKENKSKHIEIYKDNKCRCK